PLNHIHYRRPGLHGRGLGATEPLRRSRCSLLLVFDRRQVSTSAYLEDSRSSVHNCSSLEQLKGRLRSKKYWTVSWRGAVEENGPRHDAAYTRQGKIKPGLILPN